MIKITKSAAAPAILRTRGRAKRAEHCRQYTRKSEEFDSGRLLFTFDATIYGDATVKNALIAAQHGKCCFCERKVSLEGDIEHFRPKGNCSQGPKKRQERPGYYWLTYDWSNLLLSCSICNQRHKRSYFPLVEPNKRAKNHTQSISQEDPLLIDPATQDPEQHISFRKEIPYAINGGPHGRATITVLKLDRPSLNEARREHLTHIVFMKRILDLENKYSASHDGRKVLKEAKDFLDNSTLDSAEFAAMARAATKENFRISLP